MPFSETYRHFQEVAFARTRTTPETATGLHPSRSVRGTGSMRRHLVARAAAGASPSRRRPKSRERGPANRGIPRSDRVLDLAGWVDGADGVGSGARQPRRNLIEPVPGPFRPPCPTESAAGVPPAGCCIVRLADAVGRPQVVTLYSRAPPHGAWGGRDDEIVETEGSGRRDRVVPVQHLCADRRARRSGAARSSASSSRS